MGDDQTFLENCVLLQSSFFVRVKKNFLFWLNIMFFELDSPMHTLHNLHAEYWSFLTTNHSLNFLLVVVTKLAFPLQDDWPTMVAFTVEVSIVFPFKYIEVTGFVIALQPTHFYLRTIWIDKAVATLMAALLSYKRSPIFIQLFKKLVVNFCRWIWKKSSYWNKVCFRPHCRILIFIWLPLSHTNHRKKWYEMFVWKIEWGSVHVQVLHCVHFENQWENVYKEKTSFRYQRESCRLLQHFKGNTPLPGVARERFLREKTKAFISKEDKLLKNGDRIAVMHRVYQWKWALD